MKIMAKISSMAMMVALALIVFGAGGVRADEAPAAVATLAVKSLDSLGAVAKEAGIPLPPFLTAAGIEDQFKFIGLGGLAADRPIGIIFFGMPGTSPEKLLTFVLPVNKEGATLERLKGLNAQPVAGHDDMVVLNGAVAFRRTADYLIFGSNTAAAASVKPEAFADLTKAPDSLARLVLNVANVREGMPELLNSFIEKMEKEQNEELAAKGDKPGYAEGQALVMNWLRAASKNLYSMEVGLDAGDRTLRLWATQSPTKPPAMEASDRPGMPAGIIARTDLAIALGKAFPTVAPVIETAFSKGANEAGGKSLTEDQKKQMNSVGKRVIGLIANAPGQSVGVEMAAGKPVFYVVQNWTGNFDAVKEIRDIANTIIAMEDKADTSHLKVQAYDTAGQTVLRLTAIENDKTIGCMDVVQIGHNVYYSIAADNGRHIQPLLSAPSEGARKEIVSAEIDLGKTFEALTAIPDADLSQIPAETRKDLTEKLHGRKARISMSNHGDVAKIELTVDRALLGIVKKMVSE